MDFLKLHGEKLFFILLAVGLGLSVVSVMNLRGSFEPARSVQEKKSEMTLETEDLQGALALLTTGKKELDASTHSFTSGIRRVCVNPDQPLLIPVDAKICPYCGTAQTDEKEDRDGDGLPNGYEREIGLNPDDAADALEDQDSDGFITIYEYENETNPVDPASYPPLIDYLRLEGMEQKSIVVELLGFNQLTDTVYSLQLRWRYPGEGRWNRAYVRTGSKFGRNGEFTAEKYVHKRTRQDDGRFVDESYALIKMGRHELRLGRYGQAAVGRVTERLAVIKLIAGPQWSEDVRVGSSFEIDKISYKVIDIQNDSVVLKSDDSDKPRTIKSATQEELDRLNPSKPETEAGPGGIPADGMIPPDFFNPQY